MLKRGLSYKSIGEIITLILLERYVKHYFEIVFSKVEYPGYVSISGGNDIALLRLHQGIDLNNSPNINSICWPTVSPAAGVQAMTSGWGLEWQHFGLFGTAKKLKKVMK